MPCLLTSHFTPISRIVQHLIVDAPGSRILSPSPRVFIECYSSESQHIEPREGNKYSPLASLLHDSNEHHITQRSQHYVHIIKSFTRHPLPTFLSHHLLSCPIFAIQQTSSHTNTSKANMAPGKYLRQLGNPATHLRFTQNRVRSRHGHVSHLSMHT